MQNLCEFFLLLDSQNLKILVCVVILQKALKSVAFSKSVCYRRSISTPLSSSLSTSLRVSVPWNTLVELLI